MIARLYEMIYDGLVKYVTTLMAILAILISGIEFEVWSEYNQLTDLYSATLMLIVGSLWLIVEREVKK